jgi:hypothetical protein
MLHSKINSEKMYFSTELQSAFANFRQSGVSPVLSSIVGIDGNYRLSS